MLHGVGGLRVWGAIFSLTVLAAHGCGDDDGADAAADATTCTLAGDCDDGLFCNGVEACDPSNSGADARGCLPGAPPCPGECDEATETCEGCVDADGDGAMAIECGGNDCDDADPGRYPGNTEICDVDDHDEDCDPRTFGFRDGDEDGVADALCCNDDDGTLVCGDDCDDNRPGVNPSAPEACDGVDNDCDGTTDEGVLRTFWPDLDGDEFGDPMGTPVMACSPPPDTTEDDTDCDDTSSRRNPGLGESCTPEPGGGPIDEDCDDIVDEDCTCTTGAMRDCPLPGACAAGSERCVAGMWGPCSVPPASEVCDGTVDEDCDGAVDEGLSVSCYADSDEDTYAPIGAAREQQCPVPGRPAVGGCPIGFTNRVPRGASSGDCNDDEPTVYPGAVEICDRLDNDCSSTGGIASAEDSDDDGFTRIGYTGCSGGFPKTDCNDRNADVNPDQMSFFDEPYCSAGTTPCNCASGERRCVGIVACLPSSPSCATAGSPAQWDYDCDGTEERSLGSECVYRNTGTCDVGPGGPPCIGGGRNWSDPDVPCGTVVNVRGCRCTTRPFACNDLPSLRSEPVPCR